ncbi:MAG TPA: ATP-binding cassette domain-containing protein [Propionibacteriaceae bacterium]|nr:ATP-binding cassette domain-containing protein [Propionibacteriaceae bacterium]
MDRPRRALPEEPDNVESYVAKRSLGFTQADSGDHGVVRPARAARALEPNVITTQAQTADRDRPGFSDPPRPRRASRTQTLSWDLEEEKADPTAPAAAGRRAIVDLEPSPSSRSVVPSQPTVPLPARPATPEPRSIAPAPPREPAVDLPKITAGPPPEPVFVPAQTALTTPLPVPPRARREQHPYRPALPIDRPTPPQPQVPAASRPVPQARRVEPVPQPSPELTPPPRGPAPSRIVDPAAVPGAHRARPVSSQTTDRTAAQAVRRARPARWAVRHEVPPILVDRLIKSYNGTLAVYNLSFVVEPGRVTGFLGPNGAGKTTTMRILVGLVAATTGTATFGDLSYADLPHPQRTVGCVLDTRFHPGRSGRNHLRVLAPTAGASDRRVDDLLGEVGLGEVARQPVAEYSTGMQQRLALAAAMLGNPDYLILDEPANGLDPEGIRWLRSFLRDFAASGRAVLISSHLLNEIEATADDIVVINRGRLLAQLPMSELNLGGATTRARVSDLAGAVQALTAVGAEVETAADERGAYLRIHSHDVGQVGSALFSFGIAVDELSTERRDLEQEFFAMLEGSG